MEPMLLVPLLYFFLTLLHWSGAQVKSFQTDIAERGRPKRGGGKEVLQKGCMAYRRSCSHLCGFILYTFRAMR
jgi:hypothetical protein